MSDQEWGFNFDPASCTQCHACEAACKNWRQVEPGVRWRRLVNIWRGSYPNVTSSTVTVACQHCAEPACMAVCPTGAISKMATDGIVLVDQELCIGCTACLPACPFAVPQFGLDEKMQKCDFCLDQPGSPAPPCVRTCPTGALTIARKSASEKLLLEKELQAALAAARISF